MLFFRTTSVVVSVICLALTSCGGGGGSGSSEQYSNDSCSLLKRASASLSKSAVQPNQLLSVEKIIGGTTCNENSSPVVELLLINAQNEGFTCSATMLTSQYGLTAAHCFDQGVDRAAVKIGSDLVAVEAVKVHPSANDTNERYLNDFAVIKLSRPAATATAPILISRAVVPGDKLYIFGFGRSTIGTAADGTDGILRGGVMKADSLDEFSIFAKFDGQGQNACFGDSGGPAMIDVNGTLALVGVTSTGSGSANCGPGDINLFANAQGNSGFNFISSYVPNLDGI